MLTYKIGPGDLQFMTAGKGIVHAEMPGENADGSPNVGMQLWVDLPKSLKSCEPRYRDLRASEIPQDISDDKKVEIKVISGKDKTRCDELAGSVVHPRLATRRYHQARGYVGAAATFELERVRIFALRDSDFRSRQGCTHCGAISQHGV